MTLLRKVFIFIMVTIITFTLIVNVKNNTYAISSMTFNNRNILKVGVLLFRFDDPYMSLVKQSLEDIQKKNDSKVKFSFFDGKGNQAVQNAIIDSLLKENYDLLLANLVDTKEDVVEDVVNKAKQKNIPLILFNSEPSTIPPIVKTYGKVVFMSTDAKQAGVLQGKILTNIWNSNKSAIDKNKDNIMEYIMLEGEIDSTSAIARTKYSVSTINDSGIKTKELASQVSNWNKELAKSAIESLFLKYSSRIEAIISNNDAMAIGAIEALQKYGYNKGDKTKNIVVVGVDGIQEAKDLIDKGLMAGTVIQDPNELAQALYSVGTNLVYNLPPLENTNYKFDETGFTIRLPYHEYTK